jgi:hypothetical protein
VVSGLAKVGKLLWIYYISCGMIVSISVCLSHKFVTVYHISWNVVYYILCYWRSPKLWIC